MNNLTKKLLLIPGAAVVATLGLSSCGKHSIAYEIDWTEASDLSGTVINFWTGFGSDMQTALEQIVEEWSEKTGVVVQLESKGGYDNLNQAIVLSASTNTMPHLAVAYPDHEASYVANDSIVRLDYYFENDGDDSFNISDFYEDYMNENRVLEYKEDGTPYTLGVPFNKSTEVLVYNKTFFDWASTKDNGIKVPSTWDEVKTVGEKVLTLLDSYFGYYVGTDSKAYEHAEDIPSNVDLLFDLSSVTKNSFKPLSYDSQANFFITTCRQFGGKYTEVDENGKGYLAFDSQEVKAGLTKMQSLYNDGVLGIPADWGEAKYSSNPFKVMQSVIAIGSSAGVANDAPAGNKFQIDVAPIPSETTSARYVISQGTNLILLDQGSNKERIAAWNLLKYLAKEANGTFAATTGYFPSCEAAATSPDYSDFLTRKAVGNTEIIRQNTAKLNEEVYMNDGLGWKKFVDDPFVGSSTVRETVGTAMAQLFIDQMTPAKVIETMYSQLGEYVRG